MFRRMFPSSPGGGEDDFNPSTVEEIFTNLRGRRIAFLRTFSRDVISLYSLCSPERLNLCLYGYPNGSWDVDLPPYDMPPNLPAPVIGINFARDGMQYQAWLALVSVHCDCWLLSLASFFCASAGLGRDERSRLFNLINDLPTLFEEVTRRHPIPSQSWIPEANPETVQSEV